MHNTPSKVIFMHRARFCGLGCLAGCFSIPYLIHIPSCSKWGGGKVPICVWNQYLNRGYGTAGRQYVREVVRNYLRMYLMVSYGGIVKPSHCSGVIIFLLCLWLSINPPSIRCTWSHTGALTSQSYSSKFIHKEILRAELISSLHCQEN